MGNRVKQLRTEKKIRQIDFASAMGVAQSAVSNWETGRNEPDNDMLCKIADYFGVSVDYLIGRSNVRSVKSSRQSPRRRGVPVPVLGDVAAGIPIEAVEDILDYEEIDEEAAASGEYFGLRIKGSSMEPRMVEGDVVIVRRQETAETGDTVVALINGDSATVKKIKIGPAGITLIPTNPIYDPMFFTCEEVETMPVRILGKVVELRAKF